MANNLDMSDAIRYYLEAQKEIERTTGMNKFLEGDWGNANLKTATEIREKERRMSSIEREMNELEYRYKQLQRELAYRNDRPRAIVDYYKPFPMMIVGIDKAKEEKPVNTEPKNYAVKLLVDQLKQQQGVLIGKKSNIDACKQEIKNAQERMKGYNKNKLEVENKIKELSGALKKLGHKE